MRAELDQIVTGMCRHGGMDEGEDPISSEAHATAHRLRDVGMIPELIEGYRQADDEVRRRMIVRIIGTIGERAKDPQPLDFLLSILSTEKRRDVLMEALQGLRLMPKPSGTDLSPVFEHLKSRDIRRLAAILALERSHSPEAERRILDHLANTSYGWDRFYCVAVLMSIGTEAALPALRESLDSPRKDIRFAASEAIALVAERKTAGATGPGG